MENNDDIYYSWLGIILVFSICVMGVLSALQLYNIISESSWKFMFYGLVIFDLIAFSTIMYKSNSYDRREVLE